MFPTKSGAVAELLVNQVVTLIDRWRLGSGYAIVTVTYIGDVIEEESKCSNIIGKNGTIN